MSLCRWGSLQRLNPPAKFNREGETSMTSEYIKRFATSAGIAALVLAGILFSGSRGTASAHSEGAGSQNGLEGAWRLQVTVRDCQTGQALRAFPAVFTFGQAGTATVTTAGQFPAIATTGLGVWRHINDHTYSAVTEAFIFSPAGAWTQTHRLTRNIEIGDQPDEFTDTVT